MAPQPAALLERSARLDLIGIDFGAFSASPLDEDSLRCLRYMHDIEGHTMCYLRDVLVTSAHRDPEVTAFLACWAYEEHWHGDAIARVLDAHGERSGPARLRAVRSRLGVLESLRPVAFSVGSAVTRHVVALHMAWGAVNEWTTQSGYARLAAKADHPVLTELLGRIMRQEGRHIDFYMGQARERLAGRSRVQRAVRTVMRRLWEPVGSGVMPPGEVRFLVSHLFGDDDGLVAARRIDRQVDRLPGLEGMHLAERARAALAA
ncbi:MAG TPA: hypothetical protein VKR22_13025 [Acidimicrobiales bacterium]|nr:hypothetical protein [Acidimicrobiales bacterium]